MFEAASSFCKVRNLKGDCLFVNSLRICTTHEHTNRTLSLNAAYPNSGFKTTCGAISRKRRIEVFLSTRKCPIWLSFAAGQESVEPK